MYFGLKFKYNFLFEPKISDFRLKRENNLLFEQFWKWNNAEKSPDWGRFSNVLQRKVLKGHILMLISTVFSRAQPTLTDENILILCTIRQRTIALFCAERGKGVSWG